MCQVLKQFCIFTHRKLYVTVITVQLSELSEGEHIRVATTEANN